MPTAPIDPAAVAGTVATLIGGPAAGAVASAAGNLLGGLVGGQQPSVGGDNEDAETKTELAFLTGFLDAKTAETVYGRFKANRALYDTPPYAAFFGELSDRLKDRLAFLTSFLDEAGAAVVYGRFKANRALYDTDAYKKFFGF